MTPEELRLLASLNTPKLDPKLLQKLSGNQELAKTPLDLFITQDEKMLSLKNKTRVLAKSQLSVLIIGETGTGKELIARALHDTRRGPFVGFDCATIHPELMESELFGVTKGAYTGCTQDRIGLFESAKGGTLFLDEITNMPQFLQCKLLRVLESMEVKRLGSNEFRQIDCRIVAATNDLKVPNEHLRKDLYYRLARSLLRTTPLRERREDIRLIIAHYDKDNKIDPRLTEIWIHDDTTFPFEGNARELKNLVEEAIIIGEISEKL